MKSVGDRRYRILGLFIVLTLFMSVATHSLAIPAPDADAAVTSEASVLLPQLRSHPLPERLVDWVAPESNDSSSQGDYFDAIAPTPLGYLVWTHFPVTVFVEPPDLDRSNVIDGAVIDEAVIDTTASGPLNFEPSKSSNDISANFSSAMAIPSQAISSQVHHQWYEAVLEAIAQWSTYLMLEQVETSADADIRIWAVAPPLQVNFDAPEPLFEPARAAETQYEFYIDEQPDGTQVIAPRYDIKVKPGQSRQQIQATARHELGHALGLWGHSPRQTDVLYASQVHIPPQISVRDVRTLKRVYEHPTRLGWPLPN